MKKVFISQAMFLTQATPQDQCDCSHCAIRTERMSCMWHDLTGMYPCEVYPPRRSKNNTLCVAHVAFYEDKRRVKS